ncbi:MAG: fatty acid desaturase [Colwellia sp.]|jgi:Fatty acid desaturase
MSNVTKNSSIPSKDEYFQELKKSPILSVPAMGLFLLGIAIMAGGSYMALINEIPMWGASLTNGLGMYMLFSIVHESMHHSMSRSTLVNNFLGRISMMVLLPSAPFEVARWAHFQHHRFTNGEKDPDNFIHHGSSWTLLLRWSNFDLNYLYSFFKYGGKQRKTHAPALIFSSSLFVGGIVALTYFGYGMEVFFLWFLASRVGLLLIALVFVYFPHYPGDIDVADNEYQASTIRRGCEWLLTPLMVYQNYHLIHHLYPTVPFYKYMKVWHLKYDEITAQNPAIQTAFGLMPVNLESEESKATSSGILNEQH